MILKALRENTQAHAKSAEAVRDFTTAMHDLGANGAGRCPIPAPWASRAGDTPATLAGIYRQAAKLIEASGYTPCPDGERWSADGPHSVSSALEAVAAVTYPGSHADTADLAEDAHARLAGLLHLTGLRTRRTSIHDLCDEVRAWEDCADRGDGRGFRYLDAAEAADMLEAAAQLLDAIGGAQ